MARDHLGLERSAGPIDQRPIDPKVIDRTFKILKEEFEKAAGQTRRIMRFVTAALLVAPVIAIIGGVVVFWSPWTGSTVSTAALGALYGLVLQARMLARDQTMLELIPAKYQTALSVCSSQEQYEKIINMMLEEMNSLRTK